MHTLTKNVSSNRLPLDTTTTYVGAAGTTDLITEGVDTRGYHGVRFKIGFGAITSGAVTSVKAQQSSDDAATDAYSDIAGSSVTVADTDDNKEVIIEIYNPQKRYACAFIDRGTQNAVVDYMLVELFNPDVAPVSQGSMVLTPVLLNAPAEGTA